MMLHVQGLCLSFLPAQRASAILKALPPGIICLTDMKRNTWLSSKAKAVSSAEWTWEPIPSAKITIPSSFRCCDSCFVLCAPAQIEVWMISDNICWNCALIFASRCLSFLDVAYLRFLDRGRTMNVKLCCSSQLTLCPLYFALHVHMPLYTSLLFLPKPWRLVNGEWRCND